MTFVRHPRAPAITAWVSLLLLALVLFFRHLGKFDFVTGEIPQDFAVFLKGARLLRQGLSPYEPFEFLTYKYSPGCLLLFYFLPTAPISAWLVTKAVYLTGWVGALGYGIRVKRWNDFWKLMLGVLISWKGVIECLDYGQFEFSLLVVAFIAARLFDQRPFWAAIIVGSAPWLKLPWALIAVPFLIRGYLKKSFASVVAGIACASALWGLVLPVAWLGWPRYISLLRDWWVVLKIQPFIIFFDHANQSLWATMSRILGVDWVPGPVLPDAGYLIRPELLLTSKIFALLLLFLIFCKCVAVTWRNSKIKSDDEAPEVWVTRWLILILLANPLSWRWASMLLVAVPFVWPKRPRACHWIGLAGAAICLLLQQNPVVRALGIQHWTVLHDYGLVTYYWLSLLVLTF